MIMARDDFNRDVIGMRPGRDREVTGTAQRSNARPEVQKHRADPTKRRAQDKRQLSVSQVHAECKQSLSKV